MQVDIIFVNAKVYDVHSVDVAVGQPFTIVTDDATGKGSWFSDNDPVLDLSVAGGSAGVIAKQVGKCKILILNSDYAVMKQININVLESIPQPAATVGVTASAPVLK